MQIESTLQIPIVRPKFRRTVEAQSASVFLPVALATFRIRYGNEHNLRSDCTNHCVNRLATILASVGVSRHDGLSCHRQDRASGVLCVHNTLGRGERSALPVHPSLA
jgi:hypothetical protein